MREQLNVCARVCESVSAVVYGFVNDTATQHSDIPLSDVCEHLTAMNLRPAQKPTMLSNEYEFNVFYKRSEAKPIQVGEVAQLGITLQQGITFHS